MRPTILVIAALLSGGCRSTEPEAHAPRILEPHEGDRLWMFPESAEHLGSGGELQVFVDAQTHPHAGASFAKFTLGVGGALPVHRHEGTEEFAYFISGEGVAVLVDENGLESEVPVATGYVWYNPPGQWHAIRNTGSTPLSLVFATVPNEKEGLMSFFRRVGSTPGEEGTPLSLEELRRIGLEHDMILREPDVR